MFDPPPSLFQGPECLWEPLACVHPVVQHPQGLCSSYSHKSCPVAIWKKMGVVLHWKAQLIVLRACESDVFADVPCFQQRSRHIQTYLLNLDVILAAQLENMFFRCQEGQSLGMGPWACLPGLPRRDAESSAGKLWKNNEKYVKIMECMWIYHIYIDIIYCYEHIGKYGKIWDIWETDKKWWSTIDQSYSKMHVQMVSPVKGWDPLIHFVSGDAPARCSLWRDQFQRAGETVPRGTVFRGQRITGHEESPTVVHFHIFHMRWISDYRQKVNFWHQ